MHEFLEACGLDGRLRLDLDGPAGPVHLALERPFAVIGRNVGCGPHPERQAGQPTARLRAGDRGGGLRVDLGSRAGLLWGPPSKTIGMD